MSGFEKFTDEVLALFDAIKEIDPSAQSTDKVKGTVVKIVGSNRLLDLIKTEHESIQAQDS